MLSTHAGAADRAHYLHAGGSIDRRCPPRAPAGSGLRSRRVARRPCASIVLPILAFAGLATTPAAHHLTAQESTAQEPGARPTTLAAPGTGVLDLGRLRPFDAEYTQLGATVHARLTRTLGATPTWDFVMTMPSPMGVGAGVDHMIHRASDLAFAGRRFGFGAWRNEYVEATADDASLRIQRMVRGGGSMEPVRLDLPSPVVDGTFMYWALGLLPLDEGRSFTFPTWSPTEDGLEVRESGVLTVGGSDTLRVGGAAWIGRIVRAETGQGSVEMLVSPHPPYLLRQDLVGADGSRTTLLNLVSLHLPSEAGADRAAIAAARAEFSRAYMDGDTATIRSLYTGHATLLPPDRDVRGGDAVVRYFSPVPGRTVVDHRMESEALDLFGDVAIDVGTWRQTARRGDGPETTVSGRYLIQWVRGADGRWLIHRDMWHRPAPSGGDDA